MGTRQGGLTSPLLFNMFYRDLIHLLSNTVGKCYLSPHPAWYLDMECLKETESVKYLGVHLSSNNTSVHVNNRIQSHRNAFYSLQGLGLNYNSISADTVSYVWNAAIHPVLMYWLQCVNLTKSSFYH